MPFLIATVENGAPWKQTLKLVSNRPSKDRINLEKGEVRVKVMASGLAFPDVLTAENKHVRPLGKVPKVMGKELAGIVVETTSDKFKVGDWVFGETVQGAWAESSILIEDEAHKFDPSKIDFKVAASLALNYGTVYHALVHVAQLKKGETLLVLGAGGGVGLGAVELGKALGATVIACASSQEKLDLCKSAGADHLINYTKTKFTDEVERITGGKAARDFTSKGGIDVVFDPVGGSFSEAAIRQLRFGGRHLVIGFASGSDNPKSSIPKVPLNLALLNERKILGVIYGTWRALHFVENRAMIGELLKMAEKGLIKPKVQAYPLKDYAKAIEQLMGRQASGKIVFVDMEGQDVRAKL